MEFSVTLVCTFHYSYRGWFDRNIWKLQMLIANACIFLLSPKPPKLREYFLISCQSTVSSFHLTVHVVTCTYSAISCTVDSWSAGSLHDGDVMANTNALTPTYAVHKYIFWKSWLYHPANLVGCLLEVNEPIDSSTDPLSAGNR